jgi:pyruvate kinase
MKQRKASRNRRRNESSTKDMTQLRALNPVLMRVQTTRGLAARIGEVCGINRETVWNWRRVPAEHVLAVECLLNIPRHRIRPDLYSPPNSALTKRWLTIVNGRRGHDHD